MPTVQFVDQVENVKITKNMHTPKQITRMDKWLKEARKVIPEIPDVTGSQGWYVGYESANTDFIRFDLKHNTGKRVYVVILRSKGNFGER